MGELSLSGGAQTGTRAARAVGERFAARDFEDGVAVFDPVTWQTHIVSHEGMTLLREMVLAAPVVGCDPERLCASFLSDIPGAGDALATGTYLRHWAALACHLAGEHTAPAVR